MCLQIGSSAHKQLQNLRTTLMHSQLKRGPSRILKCTITMVIVGMSKEHHSSLIN
jgi:hypothetical protein